jgi:hypothetical protein
MEDKDKIKRLSVWAGIIMLIGLLSGLFLDPETFSVFADLLKEIITSLII